MIYYLKGNIKREYVITVPLSYLALSANAQKALDCIGVRNLEDLLRLGSENLRNLSLIPERERAEIGDFLDHLWSKPNGIKLSPLTLEIERFLEKEKATWKRERLHAKNLETPLDELDIHTKTKKAFFKLGIASVEALEESNWDELNQILQLNKPTVEQVKAALQKYVQSQLYPEKDDPERHPSEYNCLAFLRDLSSSFPVFTLRAYNELRPIFFAAYEDGVDVDLNQIYKAPALRRGVKTTLIATIGTYQFGLSVDTLKNLISAEVLPTSILCSILEELEQEGNVVIQDGIISLKHISALEYVSKVPDSRLRDILTQRIRGFGLNELAQKHNISYERVRQLTQRWYTTKNVVLREDKYIPLFKKYSFVKKQFTKIFNEPDETYYYLNMVDSIKGPLPIEEIYNDLTVPEEFRRRAKMILSKDALVFDGVEIPKQPRDLLEHIVVTRFRDGGTVEELDAAYRELLVSNGLDEDGKLVISSQVGCERHLAVSDKVLCKQGRAFRYYDIWKNDYTQLLDELNLDQYEDAEYSTKKFFLEHPAIMNAYDIRDEFELHNLLRKISDKYGLTNISFQRMPLVVFGTVTPFDQIQRLLQEHSPISKKDFLDMYERIYGIRLLRNNRCLAQFAKYYDGRVYDLNKVIEREDG